MVALEFLALVVILLTGLYLLGLGVVALVWPMRAASFLQAFATSASAHYLELVVRLVVGGAFLLRAPRMPSTGVFALVGWVLLLTTAVLLAVPWRWHQHFAQRAVPQALRYLPLVGVASAAIGALVLASALSGVVRG